MESNYSIKNRGMVRAMLFAGSLTAVAYAGAAGMADSGQPRPAANAEESISATERQGNQTSPHQSATLHIKGAIAQGGDDSILIDMTTLESLAPHSISTSTVVTDGVLTFDGVLMRAVLDYVGAHGATVTATALNGYEVKIPMQDFRDFDVLLAWTMNGEPLKPDDKGPFWIVYPRDQHKVLQDIRYDYRWVWQLSSLRVH